MSQQGIPKTIVSCSTKFHAFALAEQLQRHQLLHTFFTTYAWQKNTWMRRFAGRIDKEVISPDNIATNISIALCIKLFNAPFRWNDFFDQWVASKLQEINDYEVFIAWSGMALHSLRAAKKAGKLTILERGSSHILFQDEILKTTHTNTGLDYHIDKRVIEKELLEYDLCDYISIPSNFVKKTFIEKGVSPDKLLLNQYGASQIFQSNTNKKIEPGKPFRILYLGSLLRRKGLIYLFEALRSIQIPFNQFEVWFIGSIDPELNKDIQVYKQTNWKFWGHIGHYDLPDFIQQCDIAVQPSLEEGLSMVIPQMMGCGVPVIASTNTGGEDLIVNGKNGFIVPVRDAQVIAEKIEWAFSHPEELSVVKKRAAESVRHAHTWNDYGNRYVNNIKSLI